MKNKLLFIPVYFLVRTVICSGQTTQLNQQPKTAASTTNKQQKTDSAKAKKQQPKADKALSAKAIQKATLKSNKDKYANSKLIQVKPSAGIVQSPFYDALALCYAFKGYSAYPICIGSPIPSMTSPFGSSPASAPTFTTSTVGKANTANPFTKAGSPKQTIDNSPKAVLGSSGASPDKLHQTPGQANSSSITYYQIIESATGKTLMDSCPQQKVESTLKANYAFERPLQIDSLVYSIYSRYCGTSDSLKIKNSLKGNPYFTEDQYEALYKKIISKVDLKKSSTSSFAASIATYTTTGPSTTGGGGPFNATTIAEGLADFYIERVNEEIDNTFFLQLYNLLNKQKELATLFPNTLQSLKKIQITQYNSALNALKSAYKSDIKNLLSNVTGLANIQAIHDKINDIPELTLLFSTCDLIAQIQKHDAPANIINTINNAPYLKNLKPNNYGSTIKLIGLISNSMRDIKMSDENKDKQGWLDAKSGQLQLLKKDSDLFKIFMGLMCQNADGIIFTSITKVNGVNDTVRIDFRNELISNEKEILKDHYLFYDFTKTIATLNADLNRFSSISTSSNTGVELTSDYYNDCTLVIKDILILSDDCIDILPTGKASMQLREFTGKIDSEYVPMIQEGGVVLQKINSKDYSSAILETDSLMSKIFADYQGSNFETDFVHYGLFISSIATANNATDVKNAIDAFALPSGSSRLKKEKSFSVGINSYVGFYELNNFQSGGITAPLGLAINWGWGKIGSLSLYGGIIDIGAIFSYKVQNSTTAVPEINFNQILAPSIGLVYGFPIIRKVNIPLSCGLETQWGPELQKVGSESNSVLPLLNKKTIYFIAVDIPIINFYASKK